MINKVFQHSLHRELWQWLADNPGKQKRHWPKWIENDGDVPLCDSLCFACDYNYDRFDGNCDCTHCPLQWSEVSCEYSEFEQWVTAYDPQERTRLALLIKDLPVRDGVVTE